MLSDASRYDCQSTIKLHSPGTAEHADRGHQTSTQRCAEDGDGVTTSHGVRPAYFQSFEFRSCAYSGEEQSGEAS